MNTRKSTVVAALAAALLAPTISMADSPWVPANNNQGYRYQPDHGKMDKGAAGRSAVTVNTPASTSGATAIGKTREQVRNEYLNMTAAEKQRMQELFRGN